MRVLVVGAGGREHALCWAIAGSPLCDALFCAPGSDAIAEEATCVPIKADDLDALTTFAREKKIDLVVVGPEAPLVAGLVDRLTEAGIRAFGPSAAAAQLEASKGFTKDLCERLGVPTAAYRRFSDMDAAKAYIREQGAPIVVKADGLAAGKGVVVAANEAEAEAAVEAMLGDRRFGDAGAEIVIEEALEGPEASLFALCDGKTAIALAAAQDHKRAYDNDEGPNTGGMGAFSPTPRMTPELVEQAMDSIVRPVVKGMAADGMPFHGILYAGLMLTAQGPKLIEFNVRFGDPECQVLMPRLRSDLLPALIAACEGGLSSFDLRWSEESAVTVVMASEGYPGTPKTGTLIRYLAAAGSGEGIRIFHAGTRRSGDAWEATGGRVLNVTATGPDIATARARAYAAVDKIDWPGGFCRRDIASSAD